MAIETVTAVWTRDEIMRLQQALSLAKEKILEIEIATHSEARRSAENEIVALARKLDDCRFVVDNRERAKRTEEQLNFEP